MTTSIVSNSTAATFHNSPQKTGEPVDRLSIYSGKALEFDGVADSLVSDCAAITLGDPFTFSAWINVDNVSGTKLIATNGLTENSRYFIVEDNDLALLNYKAGYASDVKIKTSTITLTAGVWHYVVATFDGNSTGALYIDGALELSNVTCNTPSASTSGTTNIGRNGRTDAYEHPYAGKMCNFQLWNKAWSADDVTYAYLNPEKLITENSSVTSGITTSDLKLWLPMNDTGVTNPQTVVFDAAGTNNTTKNHATTTFFGDDLLASRNGDLSSWADSDSINTWVQKDSNHNGGGGVISQVGTGESSGGSGTGSANFHTTSSTTMFIRSGSIFDTTKTYSFTVEVSQYTSGTVRISSGSDVHDFTSSGTLTGTLSPTANYITIQGSDVAKFTVDSVVVKEIGIATGWTDADQQQYIPQTAFMDGCVKSIFNYPTIDDEYVDLNYGNAYNPYDNGLTISFWAFPFVITGNQMAISAPWSGDTRAYIGLGGDSKWGLGVQGKSWSSAVATGSEPSATVNAWVFISVTFNAGTATLYHNGSAAFTQTYTSFAFNSDFYLGSGTSSSYEFQGILDDVSIFSSSLSESEVQELYNNGLPLNATKHSVYIADNTKLKGYWKNNKLESTGKWKDLSNNNNHGEHNNSENVYIFFQQGVTANLCTQGYSNNIVHPSKGSIHFLGQEYAQFPGERIINLDGDFTIEFWFKKTEIHGAELTDGMLLRSGNNQIRIPTGVSSGKMSSLKYRDAGVSTTAMTIHSDNRKSIYEWSHVALVRELGTLKVYIDTVTTGNDTLSTTGQMQISLIGAFSISAGQVYKGFLDDFRVYDKALSEPEIAKNYKHGKSQHKNS